MKILLFISIALIFYSYIGYGIILYILKSIKEIQKKPLEIKNKFYSPKVSLIIPCYNEESILVDKINNSLTLDYPSEKFEVIFISDGSNDNSYEIISNYNSSIINLFQPERKGKSAAVNRAVNIASGEIIILSDANTILNKKAIQLLISKFIDPNVGAVSGEKRILQFEKENAVGSGEGIYWKYESLLKKWDASYYSLVGAAGELIAFRKHLFEHLDANIILDDFMMTMKIAAKGYKVDYEPKATAYESSSVNTVQELKRKVRIAAGAFQSMELLKNDLGWLKDFKLYFMYLSHRVCRWTVAPICLIVALISNVYLVITETTFIWLLIAQLFFYTSALIGYLLESRTIKVKIFFIPYYFVMMNYAVFAGYLKYKRGDQSSAWERSERKIMMKQAA